MKKSIKKILSLMMAAMLVACLFAVPAMAANDEGTITIDNATKDKVYDIYRIFDLKLVTVEGTGVDGEGNPVQTSTTTYDYTINADFAPFFARLGATTDAQAVAMVSAFANDNEGLNDFAAQLKEYALLTPVTPAGTKKALADGELVFDGLELGYYLVYPQGGLTAACSLTSTDPDAEVSVKTDYPELEKKIVEGEDRIDATTGTVGEKVHFELTSKVPDMVGYIKYTYIVNDLMSKGLTFNDDVKIKVGEKNLVEDVDFTVETEDVEDGQKITITFIDFLDNYADNTGDDIVVTYTATINENAITGSTGNPNTVNLTYSNNPSDETSTDKTPDDKVIVYTFRLDVLKVNAADEEDVLEGAEFSLWSPVEIAGATEKTYNTADGEITLYLVKDKLTTDGDGKFNISVKEGTYYLFEDVAPAGFNPLTEPIVFTIEAEINDTTGALTSLDVDNDLLSSNTETGIVSSTIANKSGIQLPSTGGRGTQVFLALGAALMIIAAVAYIIFKKKASKAKSNGDV